MEIWEVKKLLRLALNVFFFACQLSQWRMVQTQYMCEIPVNISKQYTYLSKIDSLQQYMLSNFVYKYKIYQGPWVSPLHNFYLTMPLGDTFCQFVFKSEVTTTLTLVTESLTFIAATVSFPCLESWYNLQWIKTNVRVLRVNPLTPSGD